MSAAPPLDIKIIYRAGGRGKGRTAPRATQPRATSVPARRWAMFAGTSITATLILYYATWWVADPYLGRVAFLRTPIPGVDTQKAAELLFGGSISAQPRSRAGQASIDVSAPMEREDQKKAGLIVGTIYGWLTISTVSFSLLGIASGAACSRAGLESRKRIAMILAAGLFLGLLWAGYDIASSYGRRFPPNHLRLWLGGLVIFLTLLGAAVAPRPRTLSLLAALGVILAAAGTSIGLVIGSNCGAIRPEYSTVWILIAAFVIHSLLGWVLLILAKRAPA